MNKPLEFKIVGIEENKEIHFFITFYYEDNSSTGVEIATLPKGIELNKHYSITDMYGYRVIDDRKGL